MELADHAIGMCSWSLHAKDLAELVEMLRQLKLCHLQLALGEYLNQGAAAVWYALAWLVMERSDY